MSDYLFNNNFLIESKKTIYKNYLKNYIKENKKFSNSDFSLSANPNKKVFFQIQNINIFEINYLARIKINETNKYEWVCNAYYGIYLLYKIKKCKKPYPIYPNNNEEFDDINETKTILNLNDFNEAMSKGVNEFKDLNYEINLDEIIKITSSLFNLQLLKSFKLYKKYLNLNKQVSEKVEFNFLSDLFTKKNFLEEYTYIFGSKNYLNSEIILDELITMYKTGISKFLYLDLDYIINLKYRKDLKQYFAFWLIRAFFPKDYEKYKSFYSEISSSIDFGNINYLIKSLIQFNQNNYKGEKLFFILNNVNSEKAHKIIDNIKKITQNEGCNHNFLIFCNIENDYNFNKFFEIYKKPEIKLILIPNLIFSDPINNIKQEIDSLFSEYCVNKFADLIKIFHFTSFMDYKSEKTEFDYSELDLIRKYIKFFKLIVENNLEDDTKPVFKNIKFKNKEIEEAFITQYNNYFLISLETDEKLQAVLNLNDGELFEKLIILDIITGKIKEKNNKEYFNNYNFIKLEVKSLFGLDLKDIDLEKYKGKNIIFTQKSKTAEIFDFGILINQDNQLIMKLYQVSLKKSKDDLAKLDLDIIKLHCLNIRKNLEKLGKIKIFSFGIITSFKCYEEKKKDYDLMKIDCKNKNFEIFIFNIVKKKFFIEEENKNSSLLQLENFFSIKDKYNLDLPNYDSFFQLKPKLISMKYLNSDYIHCLEKYLDSNLESKDVKIIGKIEYKKAFINSSIKDNNIGLLISGNITEINKNEKNTEKSLGPKNTKFPVEIPRLKKDIDIKIIKEKGNNKIYRRESIIENVKEIDEFNQRLFSPHILLYKFDEEKYIGKKRNPTPLFEDEISIKKRKK